MKKLETGLVNVQRVPPGRCFVYEGTAYRKIISDDFVTFAESDEGVFRFLNGTLVILI